MNKEQKINRAAYKYGTSEKVIIRYRNRKLYDSLLSQYISLKDIENMVINGEKFYVLDQVTEENITSSILNRILYERAEKSASFWTGYTVEVLSYIIKSGLRIPEYVALASSPHLHNVLAHLRDTVKSQEENRLMGILE